MKKKLFTILLFLSSVLAQANPNFINYETGLISSVSFEYDKSNLDTKDKASLLKIINSHSHDNIAINGYTDSDGDESYNKALSLRRAESVKRFLIKNGFPSKQIVTVKGNGEIPSGVKAFNRRVDVNLIFDDQDEPTPEIVIPVIEEIPNEIEPEHIQKNTTLNEEIAGLEIGQTLAIKNLNFIPGRHFLLPEAEPTLLELLQILKDNPTIHIEVQGHICCTDLNSDAMDQDTKTMTLSINRAEYVYNYLIDNGISPYRLSYKGFGASKPLVSEITEEDRSKNRRVEIMIVDK